MTDEQDIDSEEKVIKIPGKQFKGLEDILEVDDSKYHEDMIINSRDKNED